MSSLFVRQNIIARVQQIVAQQGWSANFLEIENRRATPPTNKDFYAVEFIGSEEEQITTGAPTKNTFRETGDFLIHYCTLPNTGADQLLAKLEVIRSAFRFTIINNITIDGVNPPDTTEGASLSNAGGNWYGGSILINYEYDIRG